MKTHVLITIFMALSVLVSGAQTPLRLHTRPAIPADSADLAYYSHKDFGFAAAKVVGLNAGVWTFDRFVRHADYSYISFRTIGDNFKHGFVWDNDAMPTNTFAHPYHGNLYFNAARSSGFNFWQSGLFAFGGSFLWEMCMENEYPSTNDIIITPVGGMAIGEVAYRASDVVLADNTRGFERFGREAAAFIISPMRGLTRIINGDAWRYRPTTGRQFGVPDVAIDVSLGTRVLGYKGTIPARAFGAAAQIGVEYGDRFELRSTQPYDYFKLRLDLYMQTSQPVLGRINIMGRLLSRDLVESSENEVSIGLYQHYDYYDSDTISRESAKTPYKMAVPVSVGCGVMFRNTSLRMATFDAYAHLNGVGLGGVLSDHYVVDERNYNLASGLSIKTGFNAVLNNHALGIGCSYEYYRLFTWGYKSGTDLERVNPRTFNAEGDTSCAYFGVFDFAADVRLRSHLYLTASFSHYQRSTRYRDYPDVRSSSWASRLMLTYKF